MADNILSDFGINLLEEEVDDVIFQTNEFLCDIHRIARPVLVDIADVHGTGGTFRNCHGSRHGVQDDGEERTA